MCCRTPYFACVEKNGGDAKNPNTGKKLKAYAQCRDSRKAQCPCGPAPCVNPEDSLPENKVPKDERTPWTCEVLTGGCADADNPCGPGTDASNATKRDWATWNGNKPCCKYGCTCDYNRTDNAMCVAPKDNYGMCHFDDSDIRRFSLTAIDVARTKQTV